MNEPRKKQSLFAKYFYATALVLFLSITFLGVTLLLFASQYFKQDRYALLSNNVSQAMRVTVANYQMNGYLYVDSDALTQVYEVLGGTLNSKIFLVNNSGQTLLCSEGDNCPHHTYTVPSSVLNKVAAGEYREMGNLGGIYHEQFFTVGMPLVDPSTNAVVGAVFASSSAKILNSFLFQMFRMYALSALPPSWWPLC